MIMKFMGSILNTLKDNNRLVVTAIKRNMRNMRKKQDTTNFLYTKRNKKNSKILNNVHMRINNRTINNACDIEIGN